MRLRRAQASRQTVGRRRSATIQVNLNLAWLRRRVFRPDRTVLHGAIVAVSLFALLAGSLAGRSAPARGVPEAGADGPTVVHAELIVPVAEAPASFAPEPVVEAPAGPKLITHVVAAGETLGAIARRYDVSLGTIVAANKLANPDLVREGQELVFPPTTGTLAAPKEGETLRELAARYGAEPETVASANGVLPLDAPVAVEKVIVPGVDPPLPRVAVARAAPARESETAGASASASAASSEAGPRGLASVLAEQPEPSSETASAPASRPRAPVVYEVQEGDSIRSLAVQFGVSIKTILLANDIPDPDLIKVGTKLKVLPVSGVEHVVEKGESLADIAGAYEVDLGPIIDFNGLSNPDLVRQGEKLVIPGATARVVVARPEPTAAPARPARPRPRRLPRW